MLRVRQRVRALSAVAVRRDLPRDLGGDRARLVERDEILRLAAMRRHALVELSRVICEVLRQIRFRE